MHRKLAAVTIDAQFNERRPCTAAAAASSSSARVVGSGLSGESPEADTFMEIVPSAAVCNIIRLIYK